jgi:hypothetical protein
MNSSDSAKINANPVVYEVSTAPRSHPLRKTPKKFRSQLPLSSDKFDIVDLTIEREGTDDSDGEEREEIDQEEIFDLIRNINDPEHVSRPASGARVMG